MADDAQAGEPGFRLDEAGTRWMSTTAINFGNATRVLTASRGLPLPSAGVVDCSALHPVDSAAVAVLLAIKRRALEERKPLAFVNITPSLHTLTDLYGVEDLLTT
jgi:ABC-type transporter Mla MlaB component